MIRTVQDETDMVPRVRDYVSRVFGPLSVQALHGGINFTYLLGDGPDLVLKIGLQGFEFGAERFVLEQYGNCLLYTSPSPRD